jgi:hypothetical protein
LRNSNHVEMIQKKTIIFTNQIRTYKRLLLSVMNAFENLFKHTKFYVFF